MIAFIQICVKTKLMNDKWPFKEGIWKQYVQLITYLPGILFYICNLKKVLDNVIHMMLHFGLISDS